MERFTRFILKTLAVKYSFVFSTVFNNLEKRRLFNG